MSTATTVNVTAKWQSNTISFPFPLTSTVADLHSHIALLLHLSPSLKLVGLTKGRLPDPSTPLTSLSLPADVRVLVVGTKAEDVSELRAMDAAYSAKKREEEAREAERQRQRELRQRMEDEIRREQERVAEERRRAYEVERAERERKWQEDQARREQERREQEMKAEQAGGNVTLTLSALQSPEAESKQKLILPPAALQSIVDAKVAFPLTFAVRKTGGTTGGEEQEDEEKKADKESHAAEVVYVGVGDFNSPHSSVVLVPSSVLSSLQCSEGQSLTLSTVTLPKATHITLLPLPCSSTTGSSLTPSPFLSLSPPERTALLEFHLRRFQQLQRGQIISLRYRKGQDEMRFEVRDTQPADVVSIIDADVEAEVESVDMGEVKGEAKTDEHEHEYVPLMVGETVEGELAKGHYWRGRVRLDDANGRYELNVRSAKGDADMYVVKRERTNAEPDVTYWDWRAVEVGDDRIVLSSEEARWQPGEFDIAVHAYEADCTFKLTVNLLPPTTLSSAVPYSSSTSSATSSAASADTQLCPNCHKPIPSRSLAMHELQCRRNNFACPHCHNVLLTRHLPKHIHTTHTPVTCPGCRLSMPPTAIGQHRRDVCMARLVECLYCPLLVTAEERGEHSVEDGLFRSTCKECGEVLQRKLIRRHMRLQHDRNERDITWRDFF